MPRVKRETEDKHEVEIDPAALAQGVGLPPTADRQLPADSVTIHEAEEEPRAVSKSDELRRRNNMEFRFAAVDSRQNYWKNIEKGYRRATKAEAEANGVFFTHTDANGNVFNGPDLVLQVAQRDKVDSRRHKTAAENRARVKRMKEGLADTLKQVNREYGGANAVIGNVRDV